MSQEERQIPDGWDIKKIIDVLKIIDYRGRTPPYSSSGIPHIRSANIKNGEILWEKMKYVDEKTYQEFMTRGIPKKNDLLLTTEAPMGEVAEIPEQKFSLAQRVMLLRPSDILLTKFLMYQLMSPYFQNQLKHSETGSVVKGIASKNFKKHTVLIPSLKIQQIIIQKLDYILNKLEERKKQILLLIKKNNERIIFFEKNWISYIIKQEIEGHPQRKEWKETTVGKEIELAYGKNLPKPERIDGDFPVYGSNGIVGSHHKFLINFPSIIIGRKGTVGAIHKTTAKFWPTDVSFYVKIKNTDNMELDFLNYLLFYLNLPRYSQSGPKSGLNRHDIYKIEFLLPSISDQKQITRNIKNAEEKFKEQKTQFEKIKQNYESRIKYIDHIQSSILGSAFSGKLVN